MLIPYFAWNIISWTLGERSMSSLYNMVLQPDNYFWFLWVLFWIYSLFILCRNIAIKAKIDELYVIGAMALLLMVAMVALEFRLFGFQFIAYYFLFYALGYCIHRFNILQIKNKVLLGVLAIVWAVMAWSWNMHELPSWLQGVPFIPSSLLQYCYRGLTAVVALLVIFGIAPRLLNGEQKINKKICAVGVLSLGMYACHWSFMSFIVEGLHCILHHFNHISLISLTFIISFSTSILIMNMLKLNIYTSKIFLGK